jgi:hypothetical protein
MNAISKDSRGYTFAKLAEVRCEGSDYRVTFAARRHESHKTGNKIRIGYFYPNFKPRLLSSCTEDVLRKRQKSRQAVERVRNVPDSRSELNKTEITGLI